MMASPLPVEGEEPITFTEIEPWHREKLVEMHEELFPVSYSKHFYNKAIKKEGLRGGPLFTSIAFQKRNGIDVMVGFVMAQFLPISKCDERGELFDGLSEPGLVYYILTLGIEKSLRRTGLGTELIRQCIQDASHNPNCGALYLHVIQYNIPALRFYKKNGFISITEFPGFYKIHGRSYSSELCALYLNGFKPPFLTRVQDFFRDQGSSIVQWVQNVFRTIDNTTPTIQKAALYMDDIILPSPENQLTCLTQKVTLVSTSSSPSDDMDDVPPGFISLVDDDNNHCNDNNNHNNNCNNNEEENEAHTNFSSDTYNKNMNADSIPFVV